MNGIWPPRDRHILITHTQTQTHTQYSTDSILWDMSCLGLREIPSTFSQLKSGEGPNTHPHSSQPMYITSYSLLSRYSFLIPKILPAGINLPSSESSQTPKQASPNPSFHIPTYLGKNCLLTKIFRNWNINFAHKKNQTKNISHLLQGGTVRYVWFRRWRCWKHPSGRSSSKKVWKQPNGRLSSKRPSPWVSEGRWCPVSNPYLSQSNLQTIMHEFF